VGTIIAVSELAVAWQYFVCINLLDICLQCFDAVGWAAGRASGL